MTEQDRASSNAGGQRELVAKALSGCRKAVLAAGLFSVFESLLMLTVPLYSFQMFDRVMTSRSENTLVMLTIFAIGALAVLALLNGLRSQLLGRVGLWIDSRLSSPLFAAGIANTLRGDTRGTQGLRDLSQVRAFVSGPGVAALFDVPTIPVFMLASYLIHPALGWIAVSGALLLIALTLANYVATKRRLAVASKAGAAALVAAGAAMRNADAVQGMGMGPALVARWEDANDRILALQGDAADRLSLFSSATKFVRLVIQITVTAAGCYLAIKQELTGGMMIAASIITSRGLAPIETVLASWNGMVAARESWRRIVEILSQAPARTDALALPRPEGRISLEKVSFGLAGAQTPIVKGVSLEVPAGDAVGIIGPTAAGKSTLMRLLVGCVAPTDGSVRLDGADVHLWDAEDFGRHVGYLPQDVQLLPATVAENIARMGKPDPEKVIAAAKMAGVHDLILRLPSGYQTVIGDGGMPLSGGQRQRIALARAFYGEPRVLVLDEPNSNLDTDGDDALLQALVNARTAGITVIIVTHRPHILQRVQRIAMIVDGRVAHVGSRDEMMAQFGRPSAAVPLRAAGGER